MAISQPEAADRELIARAGQGDRDAFGALYERHFQGLYDFALRLLRDGDLAADVVQSTFVRAWDATQKQRGVENVRAWLYTIAHNLAIDELRLRKRFVEPREEEDFPFAIVDPSRLSDPENVRRDRELVELVWESAAALSPQEYALLDLHLRRGFDADELSEHLGLAKGAVYTRLSRLRDSLEEAVVTTLLMRRGRRECAELDALLARLRATEASQTVRRTIGKHLDECERCQESKRHFVSPAEIFVGISLVPVSSQLMEEIWARIASEIGLAAAAVGSGIGGAEAATPGDSGTSATSATTAKGVAVSALATGAAIVIASALVFRGDGGIDDPGDVRSTTHAVGQPSLENVVSMGWSRQGDEDAYSISWARDRALPDEIVELPGDATSATSPPLTPGSWFFNLRTRGDGEWTSTVHVGPFVIRGDADARTHSRPSVRRVGSKRRRAPLEGIADDAVSPIGLAALTVVAGAQKAKGTPAPSPEEAKEDLKTLGRRAPVIGSVILAPPSPPAPPGATPPPPPPEPPPPPPPEPPPATAPETTTAPESTTTSTTTTTPGDDEIPEEPPPPPPPPRPLDG